MNLFTKNVKLDFYTEHKHLVDLVPPVRSSVPRWAMNLQSPKVYCPHTDMERVVKGNTIKTCPGFRSMFINSFMIPSWTDMEIVVDGNKQAASWHFADKFTEISQHTEWQVAPEFSKDHFILKLISPWYADTNVDVSFVICPAFWHWDKVKGEVSMPPGVMNFHQYKSGAVNNFFFVSKHKTQSIFIPAGTPLAYLIPMTERKVDLRVAHKKPEPYGNMFFNKDFYKKLKLLSRSER
jgi:hypothetical protein